MVIIRSKLPMNHDNRVVEKADWLAKGSQGGCFYNPDSPARPKILASPKLTPESFYSGAPKRRRSGSEPIPDQLPL